MNWSHVLYLASCAALPEAYPQPPNEAHASLLSSLNGLKDQVDSLSAAQMPIISHLERLVEQTHPLQRQQIKESLKETLGASLYDHLSPEALSSVLSAEVILHDPDFPNPSFGVFALCSGFEAQLRHFLDNFGKFLTPRVREFPARSRDQGLRAPLILKGKVNERLTFGEIQAGLAKAEPEFSRFCATERINPVMVKNAITRVLNYRNPAAHGGDMSFEKARRIREELLGIAARDGGIFSVLRRQDK
jgi:hypothetical protein